MSQWCPNNLVPATNTVQIYPNDLINFCFRDFEVHLITFDPQNRMIICVCALRRSSIRQGERSAATTGLRDAPIVQTVDIEVAFVLDAGCGLPAIQVSWGLGGLSYRWSMLIPMIPSCWFQAIAMTAMIHFKEQPSQGRQANHSDKSTSWLSDIINQSIPITIPSFCLWLPERPLLD